MGIYQFLKQKVEGHKLKKEILRLWKKVEEVAEMEKELSAWPDERLKKITSYLKEQIPKQP